MGIIRLGTIIDCPFDQKTIAIYAIVIAIAIYKRIWHVMQLLTILKHIQPIGNYRNRILFFCVVEFFFFVVVFVTTQNGSY